MLLSIIILNYKKSGLTVNCLRSLQKNFRNEFESNLMELIIVDNASKDSSVEKIKQEIKNYQNVRFIENEENYGFGKGCNIGAKKVEGKYLLFLNNDTKVKDKGIFEMAKYLDNHKEVSILGGQLRNKDGTPQPSAGSFYTLDKAIMFLLGLQRYGVLDKNPREISKIDWVKGGIFMIKKDVFESLGGFDERIFMYTEDMELCYRAKQIGDETFFYPYVDVIHFEHGTTNRTFAIVNIYKSLLYFYKKHRSYTEYLFLKFLMIVKALILILTGKIFGNFYLKNTYRKALSAII